MNETTGEFTPENTDLMIMKRKLDEGAYRKAFSLEKFFGMRQML